MPTQVAIAPVAVAVVAAGAMLVGTAKPVVVVAVLMVVLVVLGAYLWGSCRGSGVFTKRGIMDLGLSSDLRNYYGHNLFSYLLSTAS